MIAHTATLMLSPGDSWATVKLTCHGGEDAECRQMCADKTCLEESYALERDADGTWWHTWDGADGIRHPMKPYTHCLVVEWLDETGACECYEGPDNQVLNDTPITCRWDGDGYVWQPAEVIA